jgi:hypothetical protein
MPQTERRRVFSWHFGRHRFAADASALLIGQSDEFPVIGAPLAEANACLLSFESFATLNTIGRRLTYSAQITPAIAPDRRDALDGCAVL